ncbi:hypothetical protein [Streptomyces fulvorobeus]|uniref:Uncharacterized protein n=1 Tax=Streptomyces fulvorobeus TaxID=284028 RepID=A0A7J0C8Y3_9ACTN|nr:hypothetical protein [Streptomyces fulvorobeus]GFM98647.1 hypothetical protein Sfulv_34580 [Streptomyces fulvorobeus]
MHAARMLSREYPAPQGVLVPPARRFKRDRTLRYELRPLTDED